MGIPCVFGGSDSATESVAGCSPAAYDAADGEDGLGEVLDIARGGGAACGLAASWLARRRDGVGGGVGCVGWEADWQGVAGPAAESGG